MNILSLIKIRFDAVIVSTCPHHADSSLDRLLHHVPEFSCVHLPSLTGNDNSLNAQKVAARVSPSQSGHLAHLVDFVFSAISILSHAKVFLQSFRGHTNLAEFVFVLYELPGYLSTDFRDLPFQTAHSCFASVITDNIEQHFFRDADFFRLKSIGLDLLRDQVLLRDVDLLFLGITGNTNHFHAIQQRRRYIQSIGRRNEHDL